MGHKFILLVANEPSPEVEEEYNRWYTEKHIPDMFAFKGMKKATRFRRIGDGPGTSKYMAVYEFDSEEDLKAFPKSPEMAEAIKDFEVQWKDGGFNHKYGASYEVIKTWEKK